HEIDRDLVEGMWAQFSENQTGIVKDGLILDSDPDMLKSVTINFPPLPNLMTGGGFALEMWLSTGNLESGQSIISTFGPKHKGLEVSLGDHDAIRIKIHDGEMRDNTGPYFGGQTFTSDDGVLSSDKLHHVVFNIDGASGIASVLVDGVLSDGSLETRPYGWGRIHTFMKDLNDTYKCKINPDFDGEIHYLRVYERYLTTSEAVRNFHAGLNIN